MHASFCLEPAERIVALDLKRRRFNAGLFPRALINDFHFETAALGPAHVHAHEHGCPILAFRSPSACVHLNIGVHAVGFTGKKRLNASALRILIEPGKCRLSLRHNSRIALGFTELQKRYVVVEFTLHPPELGKRALQALALTHYLLGVRRIGP